VSDEVTVSIESVRVAPYRETYGILSDLGESIAAEGLRHPITVWKDGTLISGSRRLRAHFLMAGASGIRGSQHRHIRAVFVDTIEDAAKRLLADSEDDHLALPMRTAEIGRLWELLRELDAPAALRRFEAAKRRGIELRKATMAGKRKPARSSYSTDYVLDTLAPAFGMSGTSASRLWAIYMLASSPTQPEGRRRAAQAALAAIDDGTASLWRGYRELFVGRKSAPAKQRKVEPPEESAPAARQLATWARVLPQLEGLIAGLVELGPPHPDLARDQVAPVNARLAASRRNLEQIIKKMKKEHE